MHDDNVSHLYIARKYCSVSVLQRKNIYLRFLDLIVVFVNFVFSISQLKMLTYCQWGLHFVLYCFLYAKISTVFFCFTISK